MAECKTCKGTGASSCPKCDGKGEIKIVHMLANDERVKCSLCSGSGKARCGVCNGTGKI